MSSFRICWEWRERPTARFLYSLRKHLPGSNVVRSRIYAPAELKEVADELKVFAWLLFWQHSDETAPRWSEREGSSFSTRLLLFGFSRSLPRSGHLGGVGDSWRHLGKAPAFPKFWKMENSTPAGSFSGRPGPRLWSFTFSPRWSQLRLSCFGPGPLCPSTFPTFSWNTNNLNPMEMDSGGILSGGSGIPGELDRGKD